MNAQQLFTDFFAGLITVNNIAYIIILYLFLRIITTAITITDLYVRKRLGLIVTNVQVVNGAVADSARISSDH